MGTMHISQHINRISQMISMILFRSFRSCELQLASCKCIYVITKLFPSDLNFYSLNCAFILDTNRSMLIHYVHCTLYTVHRWSSIGDWNSVHGLQSVHVLRQSTTTCVSKIIRSGFCSDRLRKKCVHYERKWKNITRFENRPKKTKINFSI